ncbi:MAG TPA: hypothetical protein DDW50_07420, partial [Firmicutes bacterium]|nr:hypothetical protein [Bacillota bacterium]
MKNIVLRLLIAATICLFPFCSVCFGETKAAPAKIKIGVLLPMTGIGASLGNGSLATLNIARTDFQNTYPGKTIELVAEDTCSNGDIALAKLQALYKQGIRIVIGPYMSNEIMAIKEFADSHGMIIISPISTATSLCQNDNILRLSLNNFKQAEAMAAFLQNQKITRLIIVHSDDLYGNDMANALLSKLDNMQIKLADAIAYEPVNTDFTAVVRNLHDSILKVQAAVEPKHIGVMLVGYDESVSIMKAAAADELLTSVRWFGSDSIAKRKIFINDEMVAAFCLKTQFTTSVEDRQAFSMPVSPFSYLEQHLINKLIAGGQPTPDSTVYNTYDSFMLAAMTLSKITGQQPEGDGLKAAIVAMAKYMFSNNVRLTLNEFGDIEDGSIGFYKVAQSGSSYRWAMTAGYPFRSGTGLPYPTRVLFYREFNPEVAAKGIVVGTLLPLTGNMSYRGKPALQAIKQAQKDIGQTFKNYYAQTAPIRIVEKDTQSDPKTALQKLQALKAQGVNLVIGPVGSDELAAVQQYANDNNILLFSPSS